MATLGGARCLGIDDHHGRIAAGCRASLLVVDPLPGTKREMFEALVTQGAALHPRWLA